MIKVLIVDDSHVNQQFLTHIINSDHELHVVGVASNGEEAVDAVRRLSPDVITMDLYMPRVDGLEATRRIMELHPTPIVIVSGHPTAKEAALSFRLMEAGAVWIDLRPPGFGHPDHERSVAELLLRIRLMSEVRVVRRSRPAGAGESALRPADDRAAAALGARVNVVAIGASTGGPLTLQKIFGELPRNLAAPFLIVQHIAHGFTRGFVEWLSSTTDFPMHIAKHGDAMVPGTAYVAPDGHHLGLDRFGRIALSSSAAENGLRPAVSHLFRSVAETCGPNAIGVLLTGMGRDGADELKLLRNLGAMTIAQDKESSAVHGMPGEAIKINAAGYILPPETIASVLAHSLKDKSKSNEII